MGGISVGSVDKAKTINRGGVGVVDSVGSVAKTGGVKGPHHPSIVYPKIPEEPIENLSGEGETGALPSHIPFGHPILAHHGPPLRPP